MIRILLPFLKLYRRHVVLLTLGVLLAIVALLASISLLTLSGWFLAASALAGFSGLYSFNYMLPAAGVRAAAIIRTAARYFERLISHDATFRVLQHLRVYTFSKLLPLSPAGMRHFRQADLLNRLVADVDTLDHLYLRVISPLAGAFIVITTVTAALCYLDVQIACTLGIIMLLTLLLLPLQLYRRGRPIGEAITRLRGDYRRQLILWLQGAAELKIYGKATASRTQLDRVEHQWQQAQYQQAKLTGLSQALILMITGVVVTLTLWLAAGAVGGNRDAAAWIALVVFCSLAAFEALAPVTTAFQHLGQVVASARHVSQITQQKPPITFRPPSPLAGEDAGTTLEMVNVSFRYPGDGNVALDTLSLKVLRGEKIALLGRSGCGKTTLLQLLTRAWDPQQGDICLNGRSLIDWDEASLRAITSVVSQRVHLFSQTLRFNLLASTQRDDISLAAVLTQVGLDKLLHTKEGLNAWMGEGGRQLSGGELRRLGIARALLHDGDLLLLDEPTEGLDAETEQQILKLLWHTSRNKTLIMVTHRLQGLQQFDRICVMERGSIIEQGNHHELISKRGRYWHLL